MADISFLSVFIGNGDGSFAAPLKTLGIPTQVELVPIDMNGDGKLDFVVNGGNQVFFLNGDGTGKFTYGGSYGTGGNAVLAGVADLNADSRPDFVVLSRAVFPIPQTAGLDVFLTRSC